MYYWAQRSDTTYWKVVSDFGILRKDADPGPLFIQSFIDIGAVLDCISWSLKRERRWHGGRQRWSVYLCLISHQLLLGCWMWFQDITHFLLCISKPGGPPPSHGLIHSRWAQWDIWFSVQRHMYTAVSARLKQLAPSLGTTFNHAFVYVIKIKKPQQKHNNRKKKEDCCRPIRCFNVM